MPGVETMPPGRDATELDWLIFVQDGVLSWRQAVAEVGQARARHKLSSGRWRSVCHGVLLAHNGPLTSRASLWVAVLAVGRGVLLGGLTAAIEAGLRGFRSAAIHLLLVGGRRSPDVVRSMPDEMPSIVVHRTSTLPESHIQVGRPLRTTTARALVDAAQWAASDNEARSIVAAGCQQRIVAADAILSVAKDLPRARRRALTIETARYAEGGAETLSEISLVRLCDRFGLPVPDMQEQRTDASGRVRYIDAYWRKYRLQVEVDGSHHMDVRHWEADMRRQNDVWIPGDRILRFTAWQVRHRPAEVAATIRRALLAAGWDGRK
jgi:Protein of unknown function (DUF559)